MTHTSSPRRGIVVLATAIIAAGAIAASSAGAAAPLTKKKVKKIATKVANSVNNSTNAIVSKDFPDGDVPGTVGFTYDASTIIASLTVPAGNWAFHADFEIARSSTGIIVGCQMRAGGTIDSTTSWVGGSQSQTGVSLQRTAAYPAGGTVEVRCDDGTVPTTEANFSGLEIVAIEGATLTAS